MRNDAKINYLARSRLPHEAVQGRNCKTLYGGKIVIIAKHSNFLYNSIFVYLAFQLEVRLPQRHGEVEALMGLEKFQ